MEPSDPVIVVLSHQAIRSGNTQAKINLVRDRGHQVKIRDKGCGSAVVYGLSPYRGGHVIVELK